MDSLQGKFLVASPKLGDPNFFRTVVLMLQHDAEGAMGVVLTRPTQMTVGEVLEHLAEDGEMPPGEAPSPHPEVLSLPIHVGGPVPGPLVAIHDLMDCSESPVLPGLYVATQRATLHRLLAEDSARLRLYSGYSGWGSGQLEEELGMGGWLICDASTDDVLGDPDLLWEKVVHEIGQEILGLGDNVQVPDDPNMN